MPSVEVKVDVTGMPHTFITITDSNGNTETWGFYPKESGSPYGDGAVIDDTEHPFDYSTTIDITQQQLDDLRKAIEADRLSPPDYAFTGDPTPGPNDQNCTTWVTDVMDRASIPPAFGVTNTWVWNPYGQGIFVGINNLWNAFKDWLPPRKDPLAIDLDGDGIETIGADGTIVFDHDGDGLKTGSGWVSADDGFFVMDRNGNGKIDNGSELFGVDTVKSSGYKAVDGFDALSDLDSNGDGIFSNADTDFTNVKIWQDTNQNGLSESSELHALADLGIASIDLNVNYNNVNLGNGNVQTAASAHLTIEGDSGETGNLDLANNPFFREFTDKIVWSDQAKLLPESQGSGLVRDLRESMTLSAGLADIVSDFAEASTYKAQRDTLDSLVSSWASTSEMSTSREAANANGFVLIYMIPGLDRTILEKVN